MRRDSATIPPLRRSKKRRASVGITTQENSLIQEGNPTDSTIPGTPLSIGLGIQVAKQAFVDQILSGQNPLGRRVNGGGVNLRVVKNIFLTGGFTPPSYPGYTLFVGIRVSISRVASHGLDVVLHL
jgi:hypothetical protein